MLQFRLIINYRYVDQLILQYMKCIKVHQLFRVLLSVSNMHENSPLVCDVIFVIIIHFISGTTAHSKTR
jgi:hypothetical protein